MTASYEAALRGPVSNVVPLDPPYEPAPDAGQEAVMLATEAGERARQALAAALAVQRDVAALAARPPAPPAPSRLAEHMLAGFRVLAAVLAVRLMLVMSLAGTFTLALLAMAQQTTLSAVITGGFAVLTLAPLAYLETRNRPSPPSLPPG